MYFDYLKERLNQDHMEFDSGFIVYSIEGRDCYIHEIYVKPEARRSDVATAMVGAVEYEAALHGCTKLWGNVIVDTNGPEAALAFHLSMGAKIASAKDNIIVTYKELKDGRQE